RDRAGDVRRVERVLRADIEKDDFARLEPPTVFLVMKNAGVRSRADDGRESPRHAAAQVGAFDRSAKLVLESSRTHRAERGSKRVLGDLHRIFEEDDLALALHLAQAIDELAGRSDLEPERFASERLEEKGVGLGERLTRIEAPVRLEPHDRLARAARRAAYQLREPVEAEHRIGRESGALRRFSKARTLADPEPLV